MKLKLTNLPLLPRRRLHALPLLALALILLSALQPFSPSALSADASALARPRILGIAHIALYYTNLDAELAFFKDYLGYDESSPVKNPDGSLKFATIKINDLQRIELFPLPGKSPDADRLVKVALITNDCETMRQYLKTQGWQVPAKPPATGPMGNRVMTIKDPDGHVIEFIEYLGAGSPLKDKGLGLPATRVSPRIRHFGIKTTDYAAMLHFYKDILGCEETWRGSRDNKQLNYVNLRLPDSDEYLEFILYGGPEPKTGQLRGMNHICLEAADVDAAYATLQKRALPAACAKPTSAPKTGIDGKRQINAYDPEGTRVEIMTPASLDGQPAPWSEAPAPIPDKLAKK